MTTLADLLSSLADRVRSGEPLGDVDLGVFDQNEEYRCPDERAAEDRGEEIKIDY